MSNRDQDMNNSSSEQFASTVTEHPLYTEGTTHLQAGEFQKAILCFTKLVYQYGESEPLQRVLDEARFKAEFDAATRVRAKRWVIPWRTLAAYAAIIVSFAFLAVQGTQILAYQLAPRLAEAQEERRIAQNLADGNAFLEAGRLDEAQDKYGAVLADEPGQAEALSGLEEVEAKRRIAELCEQAVASYQAGDWARAREQFTELSLRSPGSCSASQYIAQINRGLALDDLLAQAEADYEAGRYAEAARGYEEIRGLDVTYERDLIADRLYHCYMQAGLELIERDPPVLESVPQALDYFTRALALRPRDTKAAVEQRLASLYLAGQTDYAEGRWDAAAARLGSVHEQRPDYLHGAVAGLLYDAYVRSGDQHRQGEDYQFAWDQYRKASGLDSVEPVLARGRMAAVEPLLTPTLTPTPTPTLTPTATPTPIPTTTPIPSPTPTVPLATFRDQILFFPDDEKQPGMWVMNPDGSNRRYLGNNRALRREYDELLERESLSPDGRYRVYVTQGEKDRTPQIYIQGQVDQYGNAETWQVTHFRKICYDPVWAPDGSRIAFVSQERSSDDIWVVDPDGHDTRNLTSNDWEWDKRPSWSPDSTRIVFWSNRSGVKQIYVIDANGRNLRNISNSSWNEHDPLWVKVR